MEGRERETEEEVEKKSFLMPFFSTPCTRSLLPLSRPRVLLLRSNAVRADRLARECKEY